jgi:hypothetical protein
MRRQSRQVVQTAGSPISRAAGSPGVFSGKGETAIAQHRRRNRGPDGRNTPVFYPLATRQKTISGLSRRATRVFADNIEIVPVLCPLSDSISRLSAGAAGLGSMPASPISGRSIPVWSCDMAFRPRDLADRMAGRQKKPDDGYLRETFTLPREQARTSARDFLTRYPKAAYMSGVESWRELPDGDIEFTMRRLRSAD